MYLSLSLSLSLSLLLSFCWSGHVFSSLWSNVSRPKISKIALWRCSLNVFVIVIVFVFVFVFVVVFLLARSCFLITLIKCLKGQKSQRNLSLSLSLSLHLSLLVRSCFFMTSISFARFRFGLEGRKAGWLWIQHNDKTVSKWVTKVGLELPGKLKMWWAWFTGDVCPPHPVAMVSW